MARIVGLVSQQTSDKDAVGALTTKISEMMRSMNMPQTLSELGISQSKVCEISNKVADHALRDACLPTNPVQPSREHIKQLLHEIL